MIDTKATEKIEANHLSLWTPNFCVKGIMSQFTGEVWILAEQIRKFASLVQ